MSDDTAKSKILQLLFDLPELQQYYHADTLPERTPLTVVCPPALCGGARAEKFGAEVRFLAGPVTGPHLTIEQLTLDGDTATVRFAYPVEGVGGEAAFARAGGEWRVTASSVWES